MARLEMCLKLLFAFPFVTLNAVTPPLAYTTGIWSSNYFVHTFGESFYCSIFVSPSLPLIRLVVIFSLKPVIRNETKKP